MKPPLNPQPMDCIEVPMANAQDNLSNRGRQLENGECDREARGKLLRE